MFHYILEDCIVTESALIGTIFNLFLISALVITMYTLNFYYLVLLSSRRIANEDVVAFKADSVTIHLPIYNEKYVAARLIDAVCKIDYPKEQMRIMVLDDSDDDTVELIADLVAKYRKLGFRIEHMQTGPSQCMWQELRLEDSL